MRRRPHLADVGRHKVLLLHLTPERARVVAEQWAMLQDCIPAHPGTTPLLLERLSPGPHGVRLERTGYHPWTTTVNVVAGELTRLAVSLAGGTEEE